MAVAPAQCTRGGVAEASAIGGDKVRHVDKAREGGDDVRGQACLAEYALGDIQAA